MPFTLLIIGGILFLGGIAYLIYNFIRFNKDPLTDAFTKKDWINYIIGLVAVGLGFAGMLASAFEFNPAWKEIVEFEKGALAGRPVSYIGNYLRAVICGFFFAVFFAMLWTSFSATFYKRKIAAFEQKFFKWAMFGSIAPAVILFFVWTDAFGAYWSYPLPSGIYIGDGVGFFNAFSKGGFEGLKIAFYAIFILSGAGISYAVTEHHLYKTFKKHELFTTTLVFGFVSGIIGARIWYVVGNWTREFASRPFYQVFEIWNGGLTVLGGVFLGVIVGALWFNHEHKEIDWRVALDIAVPTILIAQAVGRLGNFTNVEVYGQAVKVEGLWNLLPSYVLQQMNLSNGGGALADGMI
ncbi:MAG: prolipoprotein diacylglyceryl transferase, partial [Bacilli bacterium]|nr:prolipoprotein diacylglyceryl transferase [Bacilli bacterium]